VRLWQAAVPVVLKNKSQAMKPPLGWSQTVAMVVALVGILVLFMVVEGVGQPDTWRVELRARHHEVEVEMKRAVEQEIDRRIAALEEGGS
jgi:hypothetical protein